MEVELEESGDLDPRTVQASREYLAEMAAGRTPDRQAFLRRYADVRSQLADLFDGIDLAESLRAPEAPQHDFREPLGDFRIVREIGRGGMGVVYEAVQLSLGRRVAIKVLPFASAINARTRQRFLIEAQAAAQLHHTNIVPVFAVGCERGVHFYAMQLIEGRSLAELIAERRLERDVASGQARAAQATAGQQVGDTTVPRATASVATARSVREARHETREAALLMAVAAEALEYAHQAGVIHRDIKPANLLLSPQGVIWVTDFGLAQVAADVNLTQTGDLIGTLRYMSPEQANGSRAILDCRTDVYSLGATLYELLTLEPVFSGADRAQMLSRILHDDPVPPRHWDRSIPVELQTIMQKCLAKSAGDRYASAAELASDLRRFLEGRPITARPATIFDSAWKWLRRHPSWIAAGVVAMFVTLVGFATSTALIANAKNETDKALARERKRANEAEAQARLTQRAADDMIRIAQSELSILPFQDGPRQRLLELAGRYYEELIAIQSESKEFRLELEDSKDRIQTILADLEALRIGRRYSLLGEPAVRQELALTAQQAVQLEAILADMPRVSFGLLAFAPRRSNDSEPGLLDSAKRIDSEIGSLFTAAQFLRLEQISYQWLGPRVFWEPQIIRKLELSEAQCEQMRSLIRRAFDDEFQLGPPRGGPSPEKEAWVMKESLLILTPKQREKWGELIGPPYSGPMPPFDRPPGFLPPQGMPFPPIPIKQ